MLTTIVQKISDKAKFLKHLNSLVTAKKKNNDQPIPIVQ